MRARLMSTLQWFPLLAFLGPMPARRPDPPKATPDHGWVAGFLMLATVFTMVAPMIAVWGFYRPEATIRAACEASGGHLVYRSIAGDGPVRCRKV
ncbi:hypothetical protein GCM10007887_00960 [Methylobacterium haplocladii]|uniref:Uncharacterized protein n=2 Tax=Methylobacterium haplocladii TaxID=1176176 RepID=A0A512IJ32_9HYPH|nr:hypothetical protein MHA02_00990 [Methylobacterium haplocladii]GJD84027.1 hypothetical protein HPGCJGGD_1902 [Methylobacterium haplocladii]GLS57441.1 hypothetical protein GCM10007887_00960 [Methylobacterium haplocladii]